MALLLFGWMGCARGGSSAVRDIRFDPHAQQHQRFLPAEVPMVDGAEAGTAFMDQVQIVSTCHILEGDGTVNWPGVGWDGKHETIDFAHGIAPVRLDGVCTRRLTRRPGYPVRPACPAAPAIPASRGNTGRRG